MLRERLRLARERFAIFKDRQAEYKRFYRYFPEYKINGVLTPPGVEIHPMEKGVIAADISLPAKRKIAEGKPLSDTEKRKIKEAAWLTTIDGKYEVKQTHEGLSITVSVETPGTLSYLMSNVPDMGAFIACRYHRQIRYPGTTNIRKAGENLIYTFPQIQDVPEELYKLYIYTRPIDDAKLDPRYVRLYLHLYQPDQKSSPNPLTL
ncbi:MAG: hypothetical protein A3C30_00775 [Candidatus Levybacteria bacterium RIFCSPHIGHO2_02_FULL_40_18]|nr:MAG: hypothetical protein A2869_03155 [Candidatus Levybacteria bacterium RIFCSPHIGHO2_01_FULL_40_58]OGH27233.1 MAG: hypothetical protein A3C30_00775 [Candidatus Levybacteria bacterium RIFCSPHIGHO2_02_FULL_40_18]OGH31092.1 MAG: hypothetical protein A3E43_05190 [Candidatus Levybacteria bacterium RIFCSPHIGHO2_12_FULL_40_31]OGH40740.1 MAG: hypothetical protein A2894_03250 [Candidatus Levybacteria bacterium RIFCSPLOWO2_01_FULL_40_64]OGH54125.1 MAG: hypothetical protein A3G15_04025 [Candidatus Lev